jgi:hypothetical protein
MERKSMAELFARGSCAVGIAVVRAGGVKKPWLAAEEATQIDSTAAYAFGNARFSAGDLERKWILGSARGLLGFATPVIGTPAPAFQGLYASNCGPSCSPQAAGVLYQFLRPLIGGGQKPDDLSNGAMKHYRFTASSTVDVVWYDAMFDNDNTTQAVRIEWPQGASTCLTYNALAQSSACPAGAGAAIDLPSVGQEPMVVVFH